MPGVRPQVTEPSQPADPPSRLGSGGARPSRIPSGGAPSRIPSGGAPSRIPSGGAGALPVDEASVAQLVLELEVARRRGAQSRMVAQAALVVAGFALGVAVWSISRAGIASARANHVEHELELDRAERAREPDTGSPIRVLRPAQPNPAPTPASSTPARDDTWVADALLLEIEALEGALEQVEGRLTSVEGGLVEWGEETKRYVDRRLQERPSPSATPARSAELNELWLRVQALEQRLGGR